MKKYLIVIEPTKTGFSAYSPDLPGCVSTGQTREEVKQNMREAISFHLDGLREEGPNGTRTRQLFRAHRIVGLNENASEAVEGC